MTVDNNAPRSLSRRSQEAVRGAVAQAAWSSERALCLARLAFFGAVLGRFLLVTSAPGTAVLLTVGALALGLAFSLGVLLLVPRPPAPSALLFASVALDALVCCFTLAPNALWPVPNHPGILLRPDTAALLVATMGAGLRLSPKAAILGGGLNAASLLALVAIDRAVSGDRFEVGAQTASLYVLWIAGSSAVAFILAGMTRRLAVQGAEAAVRAHSAEQALWSVLGDHHDLRSRLTSATIEAETLTVALERGDAERKLPKLRHVATNLREDLAQVREVVDDVKARALARLRDRAEAVELAPALEHALTRAQERFGATALRLECDPDVAAVEVGAVLDRILSNLLDNACEGNGSDRARNVRLRAQRGEREGWVRIEVEDDGPGLAAGVGHHDTLPETTKPGSRGLGLSIVRSLLEASGGELMLRPGLACGTVATLLLPIAPEPGTHGGSPSQAASLHGSTVSVETALRATKRES